MWVWRRSWRTAASDFFEDRTRTVHFLAVKFFCCATVGAITLGSFDARALALTAVTSRKIHNGVALDRAIDTTQAFGGLVTVEPRTIGAGHTIVFQFDASITAAGTPAARDGFGPVGTVSAAITGATSNEVSVTLTGIPDNKRVAISLTGVNGILDVPPVAMGFLEGDVDNNRSNNSSDVSQVKARSGQTSNGASFQFDIDATGTINSSDISRAKARSGLTLAAANEVSLMVSKSGTGAGTISSLPAKVNCGTACAANFTQNTSVTLTATPSPGSVFSSWSGGCTGTLPAVSMSLATSASCSATFTAIPGAAGLTWDPVSSPILSGYRVYYGTAPGAYLQAAGLGLNAGNSTSYVVLGLTSGRRYYFVVTAYDTSNVDSGYSNEVFKDVP